MVMASSYQKLSIADKRALDLSRARDAAVRCPNCDMQVLPVDLVAHLEQRCAGRPEPGAGAKWVMWNEALAQGVPRETLARWARTGLVRCVGERQDRKYLLGDLVKMIARRHAFRRR
jgi:hypothetical protein